MSMPTFPENGIDLTKEQAFNMILGSIAMEELALSHIINAEGEKLQYILGTLPGSNGPCATKNELLEVNRSISCLIEQVTESQIILKNKLSKVLQAMKDCGICKPECPYNHEKVFITPKKNYCLKKGCHVEWNPTCCKSDQDYWDNCHPCSFQIPPQKSILINYEFEVYACEDSEISFVMQTLRNNIWKDVLVLNSCKCNDDNKKIKIYGSTVLKPCSSNKDFYSIAFGPNKPQNIIVKNAKISLTQV